MKKIFTLALALLGFAGVANAASVDDLAVLKHSYVLVCDNLGARPGKGVLFGDDHFLDVTGGSTATNKGQVDLSVVDALGEDGTPLYVTQDIVDKYGADYAGPHYNWLRLKNAQDVIAMKLTAKSKVIMFLQGNNKVGKEARIPKIATDAALSNALNAAPDENHPQTVSGFRWEYTVDDDGLYYFGSYNGDMFVSFIIVEANEAPGTPTIKVGPQTFENGLWFREVTCKANDMVEEGSTEKIPTIVTYTTDGSAPTAASPVYTGPIKCYKDMTLKFQAFMNFGDNTPSADLICDGADNEGSVSFIFDAPTIDVDGAQFTITSPYAEQNGKNFFTLTAGGEAIEGNGATLDQSATVTAYTVISNGEYGEFKSKSTSKDVYVLNPIKEKKVIAIASADVVVDEEATAASTDGTTAYKAENVVLTTDVKDFFVKNLTIGILKDAKAQYQVPEGQEAYIQMSNTNIVFQVAEGDSVNVKVVCTKNSCKNIDADDAEDGSQVNDRKCYVNVSGTNYCLKDADGNETNDLKLYPNANVFEFGLGAGTWTFQKYSGTGNILFSSVEITPANAAEPADPNELVINGNCEGDDGTSLQCKNGDGDGSSAFNVVEGAGVDGSRCVVVHATGTAVNEWDAQFFIYAPNYVFQGGEKYKVSMMVKADKPASNSAQAHRTPGDYLHWWVISNGSNINFTTEWTEITFEGTAAAEHAGMQTIAFNLNTDKTLENNYYFDNISWKLVDETAIKGVQLQKIENDAIFNLAGQRVDANYKGVVIMNGKKMILK